MRTERELAENVWYDTSTKVNNGEPLFLSERNRWLFGRTVSEANELYDFVIRGLRFEGAKVSFYIKPADGLRLPEIMQWIKQTFAVRFNLLDGRTGHIWGDRYSSEILAGEPPEWAEAYVFMPIVLPVKRGDWRREAAARGFKWNAGTANAAGRNPGAEGRPLAGPEAENTRLPPGSPRLPAPKPGNGR